MKTVLRAVATAVLVVAASVAQAQGERFVLISHAPDSDSWWNTIKNAIELAGDQMDVEVEYRNPPTGDLADMARIVEQAAASNPDGIIVTIADFDVLEGPRHQCGGQGDPGRHHQLRHARAIGGARRPAAHRAARIRRRVRRRETQQGPGRDRSSSA